MKIVIDIPKKTYIEIKERTIVTCGEIFAKNLVRRIRNGTPLPEHHGRIIDESQIRHIECHTERDLYGNEIRYVKTTDAPTIIEAESEDKG